MLQKISVLKKIKRKNFFAVSSIGGHIHNVPGQPFQIAQVHVYLNRESLKDPKQLFKMYQLHNKE